MKKQSECLTCGLLVEAKKAHVCKPYQHNENFYRHCGNQWSNVRPVSNDECPGCHRYVAPIQRGDTGLSAVVEATPAAVIAEPRKNLFAYRTLARFVYVLFGLVLAFNLLNGHRPTAAAVVLLISLAGLTESSIFF